MTSIFTLEEFRKEYNYFINLHTTNRSEKSLEIFFRTNSYQLPLFPKSQYIKNRYCYDFKFCQKDIPDSFYDLNKICGNTWLFKPKDIKKDYDYPHPNRLAKMFQAKSPLELPPVDLYELDDGRYIADDGNHRIYTAYLRGWKQVKGRIIGLYTHKL